MEDGRTAKVNIDDWAFIPMIPFGLLAGYWGTMEVRITALAEEGFQIRLAHPASEAQKQEPPELAFYDYHTASYHRLPICDARLVREKQEQFFTVYTFTTELEAYRREVQHLAMQYSRYIRWKTEGDDAVLAEEMTGYPAREDAQHFESLEEQKQVWFALIQENTFEEIRRGAWEGNGMKNIWNWMHPPFLRCIFGKIKSRQRWIFSRTACISEMPSARICFRQSVSCKN